MTPLAMWLYWIGTAVIVVKLHRDVAGTVGRLVVAGMLFAWAGAAPTPAVQTVAAAPVVPAKPDAWDPRLDELGVIVSGAVDCTEGCWRITDGQFEDVGESGGNHNVYVRMYVEGVSVPDRPFHVFYPSGDARALTKPEPDWGDIPIFACYGENETGAYGVYAGDDIQRSDRVLRVGLPECQHVNYRFSWEWVAPGGEVPTPVPTATATAVPTATPTVVPCSTCTIPLYLPAVMK